MESFNRTFLFYWLVVDCFCLRSHLEWRGVSCKAPLKTLFLFIYPLRKFYLNQTLEKMSQPRQTISYYDTRISSVGLFIIIDFFPMQNTKGICIAVCFLLIITVWWIDYIWTILLFRVQYGKTTITWRNGFYFLLSTGNDKLSKHETFKFHFRLVQIQNAS